MGHLILILSLKICQSLASTTTVIWAEYAGVLVLGSHF